MRRNFPELLGSREPFGATPRSRFKQQITHTTQEHETDAKQGLFAV